MGLLEVIKTAGPIKMERMQYKIGTDARAGWKRPRFRLRRFSARPRAATARFDEYRMETPAAPLRKKADPNSRISSIGLRHAKDKEEFRPVHGRSIGPARRRPRTVSPKPKSRPRSKPESRKLPPQALPPITPEAT